MTTLVSIELTNYCTKGCPFCYSKSTPKGQTFWTPDMLEGFIRDLSAHGVEAVSFGGGEPLQYEGLWDLLGRVRDIDIFKSMTTNGLLLSPGVVERLRPYLNKMHVSIHFPDRTTEVMRVIQQVKDLAAAGLKSGINMILRGEDMAAEKAAVVRIKEAGITAERVVFLPMRGKGQHPNLERFREVASILSPKFQSVWCLMECRKSDRFVSVNWQGRVGWCSYTGAKTPMKEFTYAGMQEALHAKELVYCG